MENPMFSSLKKAVKNWWVSLLVGIIALVLGIWCLVTPLTTFIALTFVFVIAFLISGISEIVFAVTNRDSLKNWGWSLALGIIELVFAIFLLANMAITPLVFSYFIAFWVLIQAIWGIGIAMDLKNYSNSGWGWLLALSILGVIIAILLLFQPLVAGISAAIIISFGFLAYGILRIYMAFRLKSLHKYLPEDEK